MRAIDWLDGDDVLLLQARVVEELGGTHGILNRGLLESAIDRARNRAFSDGNKRTALLAAETFLRLNGHRLASETDDAVETMVDVARGVLHEQALAEWFRRRTGTART